MRRCAPRSLKPRWDLRQVAPLRGTSKSYGSTNRRRGKGCQGPLSTEVCTGKSCSQILVLMDLKHRLPATAIARAAAMGQPEPISAKHSPMMLHPPRKDPSAG